jgi:ribonuclease T2
MRLIMAILMLAMVPGPAQTAGERPGAFDYYVLSLSWSPSWCAIEGDARNSPQCDTGRGFGWVLHGLWPQYDRGWPSYCQTANRPPSRTQTAAMEDIMGSPGAAWYQWKKHGRCSGLSAEAYFETARRAYDAFTRPDVFRRLNSAVRLPARVVEQAFLKANPGLGADQVTVTCKSSRIQEVRICLDKDLSPRACGADARGDCQLDNALMAPMR